MPKDITMETIQDAIRERNIETIELQYLDKTAGVHSLNLCATRTIIVDGEEVRIPLKPEQIAGTLDASSVGYRPIHKSGLEVVTGPHPRIYVDPTNKSRLVIMGNIKEPHGTYSAEDPRVQVMRAQESLAKLRPALGLATMLVGLEFEVFVFPENVDPLALDADNTAYHASSANNPNQAFMDRFQCVLQEAGVPVVFTHTEVTTYQMEVGVLPSSPLDAADSLIIMRELLKKTAKEFNATVNWEPKLLDAKGEPIKQWGTEELLNGSGLHTNVSFLTDDGKNAFVAYHEGKPVANQLSELAELAIAGILNHAHALQAFSNPSTNSGERLTGKNETPTDIATEFDSRRKMVRIPKVSAGEEHKQRAEVRSPDSMTCPHTWLAALQMAMLDAITRGKDLSFDERVEKGLVPLMITSETPSDLQIPQLHTGPGILRNSLVSLKGDHAWLLEPNGPFGERFDDVLGSYCDAILKADARREACRKLKGEAWLKAHSEKSLSSEKPSPLELMLIQLLSDMGAQLQEVASKSIPQPTAQSSRSANRFSFYPPSDRFSSPAALDPSMLDDESLEQSSPGTFQKQ